MPNIPLCRDREVEVGSLEGFCVESLTQETKIIPVREWPAARRKMLHIPPEGWAKIKKFILKACSLEQVTCNKEIAKRLMDAILQVLLTEPELQELMLREKELSDEDE